MSKPINGPVVKTLRDRLRLSQSELAEKAKISNDSLSRIERGRQTGRSQHMRKALAGALGVSPDVLTGDAPVPAPTSAENPPLSTDKYQVNIRLDGAVRNALSLVARRYRIPAVRIMELAPFLFVAAAERSLEQRHLRLLTLESALDAADAAAADFHHLPRTIAPGFEALNDIHAERASIAARDILAEKFSDSLFVLFGPLKDDYDANEDNPFVSSLKEAVTNPEIAEITSFSKDTIDFCVCRNDALRFAGGDAELAAGILDGWAQIHEMPRDLRQDDVVEGRLEWLRTKAAQHAEELAAQAKAWAEMPDLLDESEGTAT